MSRPIQQMLLTSDNCVNGMHKHNKCLLCIIEGIHENKEEKKRRTFKCSESEVLLLEIHKGKAFIFNSVFSGIKGGVSDAGDRRFSNSELSGT